VRLLPGRITLVERARRFDLRGCLGTRVWLCSAETVHFSPSWELTGDLRCPSRSSVTVTSGAIEGLYCKKAMNVLNRFREWDPIGYS